MKKIRRKQCAYCGQSFEYQRSTAKYCSDTCRVMYNQNDSIREAKMSQIIRDVNYLAVQVRSGKPFDVERLERDIIMLKSSLQALEDEYWTKVMHQKSGAFHGGMAYWHCDTCKQIIFSWADQLPESCDFCNSKDVIWIKHD